MSTRIIVNPERCVYTGAFFTSANSRVILKCGCAVGSQSVEKSATDTGFVNCPVCEFAYTVKRKTDIFAVDTLSDDHTAAQLNRCKKYEEENERLEARLDVMVGRKTEPGMTAEEMALPFLQLEDLSEVADSSDEDIDDFTAFESTSYYRAQKLLGKLKARRDQLNDEVADTMEWGARNRAPWKDPDWVLPEGTADEQNALAARKRRADRKAARQKRFAEREARRGSNKVVHNINVLHKQIPRKWAKDNPNAERSLDWEEQERAKQGWLTAEEQENMEEEEQEKVTAQRRNAWKATQSKVPKLYGSVARNRWAQRRYRLARQRFYINKRVEALKEEGKKEQAQLWTDRLNAFEANVARTIGLCAERVQKVAVHDPAKAEKLAKYFEDAAKIGEDEIVAEELARVKAEEEAKRMAEEEAAAKAKAEAGEGDEGDAEEEEDE